MTEIFNRTFEKDKRRELRSSMPVAEVVLWTKLRNKQLLNCKFRRQYSVDPYVLDFYATEVQLGIELDGESHFTDGAQPYDLQRQQYIERFGIKVLRFLNPDVYDNLDGVLEVIAREVELRRRVPQPPSPPLRKGGRATPPAPPS